MKIKIENGLPIVSLDLVHSNKKVTLNNVLLDTGCAVTIFDTDIMADIGIIIDYVNGIPTTMYGIGGEGEVCNQQEVNELYIDNQILNEFPLQLGMVVDMYGFDGLIGLDFMVKTGLVIDLNTLTIKYER